MRTDQVVIVGAGIGGLAAAVALAAAGVPTLVLERQATVGGKARRLAVDGAEIDAGPTVFTMRWVFEELFALAGARLSERVRLRPAEILARHGWTDGSRLDLFADPAQSEAAIAEFAGPAEARGFRAFLAAAHRCYAALERPFIRGPAPTMMTLAFSMANPMDLLAIKPFATLWSELGTYFRDERLRQLFGRYATYCGSSPFLAPATLMLVADVEQQGVCYVDGGMAALAQALAALATELGAEIRTGCEVAEIVTESRRASAVRLASGETLPARAVIVNADPAAIAAGRFGPAVQGAVLAPSRAERSLSAITWAGQARAGGFPLSYHTVLFSDDYRAEFRAVEAGSSPQAPTVYICAADRADADAPSGRERLLLLINAPADGDRHGYDEAELAEWQSKAWTILDRCGLTLSEARWQATAPSDWEALYPATGGALYGPAVHGSTASFRRPGSRSRVPGLYLAGGATHPGAGVPMAALSGRQAASALMADLGSTRHPGRTAMSGGTSMR